MKPSSTRILLHGISTKPLIRDTPSFRFPRGIHRTFNTDNLIYERDRKKYDGAIFPGTDGVQIPERHTIVSGKNLRQVIELFVENFQSYNSVMS